MIWFFLWSRLLGKDSFNHLCLAASILGAKCEESWRTQQSVCTFLLPPSFLYGSQLSPWSAVPQSRNPQFDPIQKLKTSITIWIKEESLPGCKSGKVCRGLPVPEEIFSQPWIALFSPYFQSQLLNSGAFWSFRGINIIVPLLSPLFALGSVFLGVPSQSLLVPLLSSFQILLPVLIVSVIFYLINITLMSFNGILGRSRT